MIVPIRLLCGCQPDNMPVGGGGRLRSKISIIGVGAITAPVIDIGPAGAESAGVVVAARIGDPVRGLDCRKVRPFPWHLILELIKKRLARLVIDMRDFTATGIKTIRAMQPVRYRCAKSVYTGGIAMKPWSTVGPDTICMLLKIPNLLAGR